eukprot:15365779-Ditylum_brightwellii.AAC.1
MADGKCGRVKPHTHKHLLMEDLHCTKMCTCHPNLANNFDNRKQLVARSVGLGPSTATKVTSPVGDSNT